MSVNSILSENHPLSWPFVVMVSIILWLAISKTNVVLFGTFFYVYVNMFVGFSTLKDFVLSSGTVEPLR